MAVSEGVDVRTSSPNWNKIQAHLTEFTPSIRASMDRGVHVLASSSWTIWSSSMRSSLLAFGFSCFWKGFTSSPDAVMKDFAQADSGGGVLVPDSALLPHLCRQLLRRFLGRGVASRSRPRRSRSLWCAETGCHQRNRCLLPLPLKLDLSPHMFEDSLCYRLFSSTVIRTVPFWYLSNSGPTI